MKRLGIITALLVFSLTFVAGAGSAEEGGLITGKLSRLGKDFIVVDGRKMPLCSDCRVVDAADEEGDRDVGRLAATEAVTLTIENGCVKTIKARVVRN